MSSLDGKVALITGAGSGIGKAAAELLAKHGAKIAALSRTADEDEATADEIKKSGGEAIAVVADVSIPDQVERAVADTIRQWGRLDIVFANAGVNGKWAPLEELTPEDWDETIDINLKGTFLTVRAAVPHLKKQGGSVIITSSVNGTRIFSNSGATAYSCSKAGQVALAKMAALELARHKVRVNVICPGWIETDIGDNSRQQHVEAIKWPVNFPEGEVPLTLGKPGCARDVAELVLFLASDASSHITGTEVFIDGAESLVVG